MMGALKPSEQYEVVHKLVTTTSADEQLLVLEALLADCHADTRMPLLALPDGGDGQPNPELGIETEPCPAELLSADGEAERFDGLS